MNAELADPIASRTLSFGGEDLTVSIGLPRPIEDHEFSCPYVIRHRTWEKTGYAIGVDGVQALQLAMKRIGIDLLHISRKSGVPVTWMGNDGDTGFGL